MLSNADRTKAAALEGRRFGAQDLEPDDLGRRRMGDADDREQERQCNQHALHGNSPALDGPKSTLGEAGARPPNGRRFASAGSEELRAISTTS